MTTRSPHDVSGSRRFVRRGPVSEYAGEIARWPASIAFEVVVPGSIASGGDQYWIAAIVSAVIQSVGVTVVIECAVATALNVETKHDALHITGTVGRPP